MNQKTSNEITIKIKCQLSEFYKIIEEKGFKKIRQFSMDDTYFIPKEIELDKLSTRNILSKAVLVRDIIGKTSNKRTKLITYKIKKIDEKGNILNQESINCNILFTVLVEATRSISSFFPLYTTSLVSGFTIFSTRYGFTNIPSFVRGVSAWIF